MTEYQEKSSVTVKQDGNKIIIKVQINVIGSTSTSDIADIGPVFGL